ncbi:M20/M25/M40 family metallo-hydrolase [Levilactobacillus tujiorum]|uniref:M20/M25/M40 family metallo-hydrolase n=1 Tax=Levilactobacillus tujiorum TaxID=2912243 RepID=A0ABX1L3Q2_9LACO|nr:M20/M25/M40 family metallo-hydrolase [Levilactobacillus tujiorum]MCH5464672.1 M20/M25/M40 family metallo-hydrolase [Levilactobacillus tujiorum]NLR11848.1 M20/M25/M40 family metallo-hydrolase [Lactobacillus sp. HBUAS51387]NLR29651.1 M20/M25/M40 family metallo-hydrolase [Levilactobacillus tujiorum]
MPEKTTDTLQTAIDQALQVNQPRLAKYLSIETVAAKHLGIEETVSVIEQAFQDLGAVVTVWRDIPGSNPFVFATLPAGPNGNAEKTLLFYNHYDVQPAEPLDEWDSDPFTLTEKNGRYVARGVSDDKGELIVRLSAVKALQAAGGLPCNLKFILEGEEEVGSPHIAPMTKQHAADLAADAIVWETGGKDADENFQITCGVKGTASFNVTAKSAESDLHSSLAAFVDNAVWRLVQGLATLRGPKGEVLVDGFYEGVSPLTPTEQAAIDQLPFNEAAIRQNFELKLPLIADKPAEALINRSTITINGISGGYEGDGLKTVLPKQARAQLDCRLVPGQDPKHISELVQAQLDKNGFSDLHVSYNQGEPAFRSDLTDEFVQTAVATAHEVYGDAVKLVPNAGGSGPEAPFAEAVGAPIVSIGSTWAGSGAHAPNENVRVKDFTQAARYTARLLQAFGQA